MKSSVSDIFPSFSEKFEGRLNFMYLDIKRLVTTGIGNLIDPLTPDVLNLPWRPKAEPDRSAAENEIRAEWEFVKSDPDARSQRGGGTFRDVTSLELSNDAVDDLVRGKVAGMETFLKNRQEFSNFDDWPADAQLGLLSMAWAMGPAFRFPNFQAACAAQDFRTAADESHIDDTANPGLRPRNAANRQLFLSAADGIDGNLDPDEVHLP
jgi:GH24 family phage-related lysozyme (muramidase)